jgi:hypothetical protein
MPTQHHQEATKEHHEVVFSRTFDLKTRSSLENFSANTNQLQGPCSGILQEESSGVVVS